MTVVIPEYETAQGNCKVAFVPAIAVQTAPTVAELTAGEDISTFLVGDWAGLTAEQNKGEQRRFASKQTFEELGFTKYTVAPLQYTWLPQAGAADPANAVKTALAEDTEGFLVFRYGPDAVDAFVATEEVFVYPAKCGAQNENTTGSDEFAPFTVNQELAITGFKVPGVVAT